MFDFGIKDVCPCCDKEVEVDLAGHSSGLNGSPAMTTLDYSCGCSVTHSNKESILTSKDGVKYKVVGSKLEKIS